MGSFGKNEVFIQRHSERGMPLPRALSPGGAREGDAGSEAGAPMKNPRDQLPGLWGGRSWLKMGSFGKNGGFIPNPCSTVSGSSSRLAGSELVDNVLWLIEPRSDIWATRPQEPADKGGHG